MKLDEALAGISAPDLKLLSTLMPGQPASGRKADLIVCIRQHMLGDGAVLRGLWEQLSDLERLAVAETVHGSAAGRFDPPQFRARHGALPSAAMGRRQDRSIAVLPLFLFGTGEGYGMPTDLATRLRAFVPKPPVRPLASSQGLPDTGEPLEVRETEFEALRDLGSLLQLTQSGRVKVGPKTGHPNHATLASITESLVGGDFYPAEGEDVSPEHRVGSIKAFAWPLLLQAAKLAAPAGGRLQLTRAGLQVLNQSLPETIKLLWQRWRGSTLLDEFSRVDAIKGQRAKGRVMTAIATRREVIADALCECPTGEWVAVDELSRHMRAEGHLFEITHSPWKLYIGEPGYGALGYSGSHDWSILQARYLRALLFEYAATLGMVDVAYQHPKDAARDFRQLWGTDQLLFLSRYDGLQCLRLTPLGAWCLGVSETYAAAAAPAAVRLSVLPSLRVRVAGGAPDAQERVMLDTWAEQEGPETWALSRDRILDAIERGMDEGALLAFLQARDDQPLPESVEAFLAATTAAARSLRPVGQVLLLECRSAEVAARIADDAKAGALCRRTGERGLIVELDQEARFRRAVRALGLGFALG